MLLIDIDASESNPVKYNALIGTAGKD